LVFGCNGIEIMIRLEYSSRLESQYLLNFLSVSSFIFLFVAQVQFLR
jgi:hypothetical protein